MPSPSLLTLALSVFALVPALDLAAQTSVPLWPKGAPEAKGQEAKDQPTLDLYPVPKEKAGGGAVLVCPGGGYGGLALGHEGKDIAAFLNERGVTAYVLHYRLGSQGYHHPVIMNDAKRALRWARAHAAEHGWDPAKLGIWGFSAGGHLASTAAIQADAGNPQAEDEIDRVSSRPDFLILSYPVITLMKPFQHEGSARNLLGPKANDEALRQSLSGEQQDLKGFMPTFLFHTSEDKGVPAENALQFAEALSKANVPFEFHLYQKGKHGVGLAPGIPGTQTWPDRLADWMRGNGWMK